MPANQFSLFAMILCAQYRLENALAAQQAALDQTIRALDEMKSRIDVGPLKLTTPLKVDDDPSYPIQLVLMLHALD